MDSTRPSYLPEAGSLSSAHGARPSYLPEAGSLSSVHGAQAASVVCGVTSDYSEADVLQPQWLSFAHQIESQQTSVS